MQRNEVAAMPREFCEAEVINRAGGRSGTHTIFVPEPYFRRAVREALLRDSPMGEETILSIDITPLCIK
jgi:hypothetical protein